MEKNVVDRKKYSILWYVDENKLLHVDPNVVTDILLKKALWVSG